MQQNGPFFKVAGFYLDMLMLSKKVAMSRVVLSRDEGAALSRSLEVG